MLNASIVDVRPFELEKLDSLNFQKGLTEGEILQFRTMHEQVSVFADNMEDKGIEKERAQNFQNILIRRATLLDPDRKSQLIYTTSYITDDLLHSEYIVGEYYTKNNPSLKHINK